MAWLENLANLVTTGAICTYAAYDLYRRWSENNGNQQGHVCAQCTLSALQPATALPVHLIAFEWILLSTF